MKTLNVSQANDQELMSLLLKEDLNAWSELIKRYSNLVYSIAYQILKDRSDTEDAVQNTFIRVKMYSRKFDLSLPVKPWLARIASGEAIRIYQQRKIVLTKESKQMKTQLSDHASQEETIDPVEQKEIKIMVGNAIDQLPEASRVAITLYFMGGLSQTEIAKKLGLSQFSISERINAGLDKIRVYLKKAGIHSSIILSPTLIQESMCSQMIPLDLMEKLTHAIPSGTYTTTRSAITSVAKKTFLKSLLTSFGPICLGVAVVGATSAVYLSKNKNTETSLTTAHHKSMTNTPVPLYEEIVKDIHFKGLTPISSTIAQFHNNKPMLDLAKHSGQEDILSKWNIETNQDGTSTITRKANTKKIVDGFYLPDTLHQPHMFKGTINVGGRGSNISFVMGASVAQEEMQDQINTEAESTPYVDSTANISAMTAVSGIILDFVIYIFPLRDKLITVSIIYCDRLDYQTLATKQIKVNIPSGFKFGILSDGEIKIQKFKQYQLPESWNYQQEKDLLAIQSSLSEDFFNLMTHQNFSTKVKIKP